MKILQIVRTGRGQTFLVVDDFPKLVYHREKNIITGTDGIFYRCYCKQHDPVMKAFAGRLFDLTMDDKEIVHCSGEWWDGGYPNIPMVELGLGTISRLKACYVYTAYYAATEPLHKLLNEYKGDIKEYWAYAKYLRTI